MNDRITRYIQKLKAEKKKQKQAAAFITAMSLVVSGTVSWQLHGIGTAMIDENLTEKTDENIHQLSDDTLLCENPQIWENDLPDITGSNIRESVALIAGSQIGYEENTENFILDEDGESHKCYTRYGDWYGNPYGEWNTMFTYFCMKYGGVDEDDIPFGSGCWAWSVDLEKENLLIPMDRGSPQRGDVLLLDSDMDGSADRSGIVSELANEDDEKLIKVIEGNVGGTVAEQEYSIDDEHIIGFLALADNAETAVQTEETEAEVPIVMKFSGISESGVEVMASADVGTFPEGTVMTVSDIDHDEAVKAAKDSLDADTEMLDAVAVDISFSDKDGNEIEPCADTTVQVQIILPDEMKLKDGEFSLLHIADSGDVQKVENADVSETGAEFVAEEFSIYVVTSSGEVEKDKLIPDGNNGYINNSQSNPYVVPIGSVFTVAGYTSDSGKYLFGWDNDGILDVRSSNNSNNADQNGMYRREKMFYAKKAGNTSIRLELGNGKTAILYIKVQLPPENDIYLVRNEQEIDKDNLYKGDNNGFIANSEDNPYHIMVGETIKLAGYSSGNGWLYLGDNSVLSRVGETKKNLSYETNGINRTEMTVKGDSPGVHNVSLDIDGTGKYVNFWIEVLPHDVNYNDNNKCDLYVKTALDDRNIDCVNEWLGHNSMWDYPIYESQSGKYIPNCMGTKYSNGVTEGRSRLHPYLLSVGQSAEIYVPADIATDSMTFSAVKIPVVDSVGGDKLNVVYGNLTTNSTQATNEQLAITPNGKASVKIDAYSAGLYKVTLKDGTTIKRDFYIYVVDENFGKLNHSDIEISDGGVYTIYEVKVEGNTKTTTLKKYTAVIDGVNNCDLFDKNGTVKQQYIANDYKAIGNYGESQYEYTSNPFYSWFHNKDYTYSEIDHVVFDVNLKLAPIEQYTITETRDSNNNWIHTSDWQRSALNEDVQTITNVLYTLNEQDMIDAFNKCPNHTGMDFTARANGALVQLNAEKELIGRDLQDDEFQYELIDQNDQNNIWTSKNKGNGTIELFNHAYSAAGKYEYIAREVVDNNDTSTVYDKKEYRIIVNVTEKTIDDVPILIAEIDYPDGVPKATPHIS